MSLPSQPEKKRPPILRDRPGRPVDLTAEDRAERTESLRDLFACWAAEDAASGAPDETDNILRAIEENRH
ncbi:MAG: hypothetical protein U0800_25745 [Isosphaeraceae bacterium]